MDGSVWWKKLIRIRNGVSLEVGNWFEENLLRKVGNGAYTFFGSDPWLGETTLREQFRRLYDLSVHRWRTAAVMFSLGWGEG